MANVSVIVYDTREIDTAVAQACARANQQIWDGVANDTTGTPQQDIAALWSGGQGVIASLGGTLKTVPSLMGGAGYSWVADGSGDAETQTYSDARKRDIATLIATVFGNSAATQSPNGATLKNIQITGGVVADAAIAPALILAWGAAIFIGTTGAAILVHELSSAHAQYTYAREMPAILDRQLQRDIEARIQHSALADLIGLAAAHTAAEKAAGTTVAWSPAETAAIDTARLEIESSIERQGQIKATGPIVAASAQKSTIAEIGDTALKVAGAVAITGAVAAGGLYLWRRWV